MSDTLSYRNILQSIRNLFHFSPQFIIYKYLITFSLF